jgi:TPP-dependent pyruvate/acetoin dehydrogenase alpha subunit
MWSSVALTVGAYGRAQGGKTARGYPAHMCDRQEKIYRASRIITVKSSLSIPCATGAKNYD